MRVAGADPGRKGCLVVVDTEGAEAWGYKLCYDKAGHLDTHGLVAFLKLSRPTTIILEKVQGFSGSGVTQTFNFGFSCGELNAVLVVWSRAFHASMVYAVPQAWQKVVHVGVSGKDAKTRSMIAYERLYPHGPIKKGPKGGKIDDNMVDALLLATYGVMKITHTPIRLWDINMITTGEATA